MIVHLCRSPIAGAAWSAAEAFREAGYDSIAITPTRYNDGRVMPRHEDWPPGKREIGIIRDAELIFCHQGRPYRESWYPRGRPTVVWYHSQPVPGHIDRAAELAGWPWGVEAQHQTRLYPGCVPLPNLIPLCHPWYQPQTKAQPFTIAYSPSNRTLGGWDNKGYAVTIAALGAVHERTGARIDVIEGRQLEECLRRKAQAHVVIDEVVTGAYHRSSLEGLAMGCVVINACDELCAANIKTVCGAEHPFALASPDSLAAMLCDMVRAGPDAAEAVGRQNRAWMEAHWRPDDLIAHNLKPLMEEAEAIAWRSSSN